MLLAALLAVLAAGAHARDTLRVAVASNFAVPLEALASEFEALHDVDVLVSAASTGKLYAQIRQGAPFEVFLAADAARPARLEAEGLSVPGSRFTYALGRLVLWSPEPRWLAGAPGSLATLPFHRLAIANPKTAPYGAAARATLQALGTWERLEGRLVRGENIAQTFQFVASGAAELGFVALSQVIDRDAGARWVVPRRLHPPLAQQAVLLRRGADNPVARAFVDFLRTGRAAAMIRGYGYEVPGE